MLRDMNGSGCVLVGDPNYYRRFGFKNFPQLIHEGVPQKFFLALSFNKVIPNGVVVFHKGFLAKK
jgi:putative acetyltransferase